MTVPASASHFRTSDPVYRWQFDGRPADGGDRRLFTVYAADRNEAEEGALDHFERDLGVTYKDWAAVVRGHTVSSLSCRGEVGHDRRTDEPGAADAQCFPTADLRDWSGRAAKPTPFLMAGYIPAREVTLATGAGGANKSTFGQQLATCMAAGKPMLGVAVQPGPALYVTAEDDDDRLHWMQQHICKAIAVPMADLAGKLHLSSIRGRLGNELATFDFSGKLQTTPAFAAMRATLKATGARLLILDNASHLFIGNENDRGQVTSFANLLYSLVAEFGVTIVLIAHTNKAGDSYSGSTAWLNAVRSQIVLQRPEDGHDPDARVLTVGKANYARTGQELRFRWHDFALLREDEIAEDVRADMAATAIAGSDNETFLKCLNERNRQGRPVSERPSVSYAPKVFVTMPEAKGVSKARLTLAMDRLFRLGRIERGILGRDPVKRRDIEGLREVTA